MSEAPPQIRHDRQGLTSPEVEQRIREGLTNVVDLPTSRSLASIARENILTLFNGILSVALIVVLVFGSWRDALFAGVMIINSLIGIISEYRAKRTLDSLAIVDAPKATVIRNGEEKEVLTHEVVKDDVLRLALGDSVPVDGPVLSSEGLEVDESMLTGESRPVRKNEDDNVLAGTSVVAGSAIIRAEKVGEELYAQGIARQARTFSLATSEIQQGVNTVLRWISWGIIPLVALTLWSQQRLSADLGLEGWQHALILAVAAAVGMIPQGLVLLTSMNFAIGAATLARRNVLVQELPAVEVLARVDALCLDKTGTLTTGGISLGEIRPLTPQHTEDQIRCALVTLAGEGANPTAQALLQGLEGVQAWNDPNPALVPFSSARKWSGWSGGDHGTWILGAPEIVLDNANGAEDALTQVNAIADEGRRVVALVYSAQPLPEDTLPENGHAVALVILDEELRGDAHDTLAWFRDQGVRVRVISGDNARTVGALARRLGLSAPDGTPARAVDARTLPEDMEGEAFQVAIREADVFGRVTPEQKRAMVRSLQADGHCVAMTGDGVNDALALKDADLGIAMGNAARATKAVAQVILLDGLFSVLPEVVARGRRIIANMERVSSLFFAKTTYALLLVVFTSIFAWQFPFLPRHYSYIGQLTIGIPAFFIALAPNTRIYRPGFLKRTLFLAIPVGAILAISALVTYSLIGRGTSAGSSAAVVTMSIGALWLLSVTARPLVPWRIALLVTAATAVIAGVAFPASQEFFELQWPTSEHWLIIGVCAIVECALIEAVNQWRRRAVQ